MDQTSTVKLQLWVTDVCCVEVVLSDLRITPGARAGLGYSSPYVSLTNRHTGDTKKRELLKNPTKIEEIQEKKLLTEIEPLQLAI